MQFLTCFWSFCVFCASWGSNSFSIDAKTPKVPFEAFGGWDSACYDSRVDGWCSLFAQERKLIPDAVVEDILSLNSLDLELYEHAEMLYAKQKQLFLSLNQPQVPFSSLTSPSNLGVLFTSTAYMLIGLSFEPEDQDEIGTWCTQFSFCV